MKTQATVFSLSTSKEKVAIKLGDKTLPQVQTHTFLGVKLDTRLSWKPHIEDMEKIHQEACCPVEIVWNTLGCQLQNSKNRLHGSSPAISGIWGQCQGDSSQDAHQRTVQNIGLRTILGAMKTTLVAEMEKTAGVEPLEGRRQAKLFIHAEKMKMPDHPLHRKLKDPTKKQIEKDKSEPPSKGTAERICRHPYK